MAMKQLTILTVLLKLITGNMTNTPNYCSPANIQQFHDKYCTDLVNSTVIEDIEDFGLTIQICNNIILNFQANAQNEESIFCKEVRDCLLQISSTISVCLKRLESNTPIEYNDTNRWEEERLEFASIIDNVSSLYFTFLGMLFIIGILTNGLLVIIFSRHERARNDPMLVNLVVADIFSLIVNMPVYIMVQLHEGQIFKNIFIFTSHTSIFISEYSLVIISFERFRAVFVKTELRREKKFPQWIKLTVLWGLGLLYGVLHYCFVTILDDESNFVYQAEGAVKQAYVLIVTEGLIPSLVIGVFSVLTSRQLSKLAEKFPGERSHHVQRIKDRYLAAKALIAFVVLFLISYMPHYIVIIALVKSVYIIKKFIVAIVFTRVILFFNSAFNPLVLYFLSSKFRRYFKSYVTCKTHELD